MTDEARFEPSMSDTMVRLRRRAAVVQDASSAGAPKG